MASADRYALIVAVDRYDHAQLRSLVAPSADADALREVLARPDLGHFDVRVVHNAPANEILRQIEDFFTERKSTDLALVHFSGHGLKTMDGRLHLAGTNTIPDRLTSTAIEANAVRMLMVQSRARSAVLLLDCCYSGAFVQGMTARGGDHVDVEGAFSQAAVPNGKGRAVITASDAVQYAFEGQDPTATGPIRPSVFTGAIVDGITSGAADRDGDGQVSLAELFDFVSDHVRRSTPHQTPSKSEWGLQETIVIARSPRRVVAEATLSAPLLEMIDSVHPEHRMGAILELTDRLDGDDVRMAAAALRGLQKLAGDDSRRVSERAGAELDRRQPRLSVDELDLGAVDAGSRVERVCDLTGVPLVHAASVTAEGGGLSAYLDGGSVHVLFTADSPGPWHGLVGIQTPLGALELPVRADVRAAADSAVAEPALTEPTLTEPPVAEPAAAAPAVTEPLTVEPAAAEPAITESPDAEPADTEPPAADLPRNGPAPAQPTATGSPTELLTAGERQPVDRSLVTAAVVAAAGVGLLAVAGLVPFTSGDQTWLDVLSSDANTAWWLSLVIVPLMFVNGVGGLIGIGLAAGGMWMQLFLAVSAFVHTFSVGDQLYYGTLAIQAAGAVLVLAARELLVRRRSGPPRSEFRPVAWPLLLGGAALVAVGTVRLIAMQDELAFYRPEDVYLFLIPLLTGSAAALVPVALRLGVLPLAIGGGTYVVLTVLLTGTQVMLWWGLAIVAGWLVARGAELIRNPLMPGSAGRSGP